MRDNPSNRPRIDVPRTGWDYVGEALALAGVITIVLVPILAWTQLPEQVPRHFGMTGTPTSWAGRGMILFPTGIAIVTYIGLTLLGRIPHHYNYPSPVTERNAAVLYRLGRSMVISLKAPIVWMFLAIVWGQARVATGDADRLNPMTMIFFLVSIHVVLGVFIYRTYRHRDGEQSEPSSAPDSD